MKRHFDLISIIAIVLFGPFFVFPKERWNWILLLVMSILFLCRLIIERRFLPKTPIDTAVALLLGAAFAGVLIIKDVGESTGKLAGLVYGIVVFYALIEAIKTPIRLKIAVLLFIAAGLILAVVGRLDRLNKEEPFFESVESKMPKLLKIKIGLSGAEAGVNPNAQGGVLLLFIPIGLIQIPLLVKKKNEYTSPQIRGVEFGVIIVVLAIQAIAIILSISFGTWFALAVALWLMGEWKRPVKAIIAGVFLSFVFFFFMRTSAQVLNEREKISGAINYSVKNRVAIWKNGLKIANAHPVFGIGMDQLRRTKKFKYEDSHAHNQFLHTAAELGIPGLIGYMAILIGVFWMAKEVRRSALPEWMRLTSRGLGTGIFAFTLFGLGDAIPLGAKPGIFFWISLAMITSIYLFGRDNGFMAQSKKQTN